MREVADMAESADEAKDSSLSSAEESPAGASVADILESALVGLQDAQETYQSVVVLARAQELLGPEHPVLRRSLMSLKVRIRGVDFLSIWIKEQVDAFLARGGEDGRLAAYDLVELMSPVLRLLVQEIVCDCLSLHLRLQLESSSAEADDPFSAVDDEDENQNENEKCGVAGSDLASDGLDSAGGDGSSIEVPSLLALEKELRGFISGRLCEDYGRRLRRMFHPLAEGLAAEADRPELVDMVTPLTRCFVKIQQVSAQMIRNDPSFYEPERKLLERQGWASDYARLLGFVALGWVWLNRVRQLENKDSADTYFARYFFHYELPQADALARLLTSGMRSHSVLDTVSAEDF